MISSRPGPARGWTLFWLLGFLMHPTPGLSTDPIEPAGEIQTGAAIYQKRCKACHGVQGDGKTFAAGVLDPPPRDFTTDRAKEELTRRRMIASVAEGRRGTAMMPWKSNLSREEIRAVVAYIRKTFMGSAP